MARKTRNLKKAKRRKTRRNMRRMKRGGGELEDGVYNSNNEKIVFTDNDDEDFKSLNEAYVVKNGKKVYRIITQQDHSHGFISWLIINRDTEYFKEFLDKVYGKENLYNISKCWRKTLSSFPGQEASFDNIKMLDSDQYIFQNGHIAAIKPDFNIVNNITNISFHKYRCKMDAKPIYSKILRDGKFCKEEYNKTGFINKVVNYYRILNKNEPIKVDLDGLPECKKETLSYTTIYGR